MKYTLKFFGSYFLPFFFLFSFCFAQSHQGAYMHIDYLKIPADKIQTFTDQVNETLKPIHEARLKNNSISGWSLYKVSYPGTQEPEYNYVTISISDEMAGFEDLSDQITGDFSGRARDRILKNYDRHFIPNHSELWVVRNSSVLDNISEPSRYIRINYMNVALGHEYEYQMFEDEIAKPLHEHRMQLERMQGWELFELIVPGGIEYGYNFSTADYYQKLENIEFGFTEELIRQNHPDTNINEFFENIYRTRDMVRIELWELVDYVNH